MEPMPMMTQPWPQIVARYDDFKGEHRSIRALGALARRITQSPLASGLHAWTSMFDLCIVPMPVSVDANQAWPRLIRFLDQLRWFPDVLETLNNGTSL